MYNTKLNYTGIKIGKILLEIIIACNLTKTSDYNKGILTKNSVIFQIKILRELTNSISLKYTKLSYSEILILSDRDAINYLNQICTELINTISEKVITQLQEKIVKLCVYSFLYYTPIGGKEERRFDSTNIIKFASSSKSVHFYLKDKITFGLDGIVYINSDNPKECTIGVNIMDIYTKFSIKEKEELLKIDEEVNNQLKSIREMAFSIIEAKSKIFTVRGFECKSKCELSLTGKCTCKVNKYLYRKMNYEWDYCDNSECNK
jgi:hypothetical protein